MIFMLNVCLFLQQRIHVNKNTINICTCVYMVYIHDHVFYIECISYLTLLIVSECGRPKRFTLFKRNKSRHGGKERESDFESLISRQCVVCMCVCVCFLNHCSLYISIYILIFLSNWWYELYLYLHMTHSCHN